jgi:hypothetical protein
VTVAVRNFIGEAGRGGGGASFLLPRPSLIEAQVHGFSNFWKISKEQTRFVVQFHKKIVPVCQEN